MVGHYFKSLVKIKKLLSDKLIKLYSRREHEKSEGFVKTIKQSARVQNLSKITYILNSSSLYSHNAETFNFQYVFANCNFVKIKITRRNHTINLNIIEDDFFSFSISTSN